jgi:alpha-amylase
LNAFTHTARAREDALGHSHEQSTENVTLFEGFEWYTPEDDGAHWGRLKRALPGLKSIGVDHVWLPPACKAGSSQSNGYDIYDLSVSCSDLMVGITTHNLRYDLGEFEEKGSRRTKWGHKGELVDLTTTADNLDIGIIFDAVLNHKAWADRAEEVAAVMCDPHDRRMELTRPKVIKGSVTA